MWCPDPATDIEIEGPFFGEQGFYDLDEGWWWTPDHFYYYQYNITDIPDPFLQREGTIYWLELCLDAYPFYWGWKTSADHFMDGAVAYGTDELHDPETGELIDFAFVITGEPVEHKMHFPQLPDEDGWDVNATDMCLADDWECSETGYVTDVHFWGSWEQGYMGVFDGL